MSAARRTKFVLAERLHMTVYELERKMPVAEMFEWLAYFAEESPKEAVIDLSSASTDQLKGLFG